jgi:hypothetical protein
MSGFRRGACALLLSGSLAVVAGCDDKKAAPAAAPSGIPPLDDHAAAPSANDRPVHDPVAGTAAPSDDNGGLPAGHPPLGGLPPGHAAMAAGATTGAAPSGAFAGETPGGELDPKTVISGVLKLDGKVKAKVQPGDTIFVVARRYEEGAPPGSGTPLAVKKLTVGAWPLEFSLDSRDAMLVGTKMEGKVVVTARVDKDGDAITKNPGDVIGQSKAVVPPQKNVVVPLDTLL